MFALLDGDIVFIVDFERIALVQCLTIYGDVAASNISVRLSSIGKIVFGAFFAIDDTCPHQGASLGEGTLHEGRIICPWHNFVFELRTGHCRGIPQSNVACYPTRRSGDDVEVELPDGTGQEPE